MPSPSIAPSTTSAQKHPADRPTAACGSFVCSRSSYREFHQDLELAVASLVTNESFDSDSWNRDQLRHANSQLWNLAGGGDVDYGCLGIGRMYASWYHLRRVRGAFEILRPRLEASGPITVLDLGCGTGAVAWALGMLGLPVRYIGVDASAPMLTWARGLWDTYRDTLPECDTVEATWIQGDAISSLLDGSLGDEADLAVMPFLMDWSFINRLRARGDAWRSCLEHMGVADVISWTTADKLAASLGLMQQTMGSAGLPANPCGWHRFDPPCTLLHDARLELSARLGLTLRDKQAVGVAIWDTVGHHFRLTQRKRPRNSLSLVAHRLGLTTPQLQATCRTLGFENADALTMATGLTVGQLESIHRHLGRKLKLKEYAR